ncbi:MAG: GatB/YqeY domain-containing protein [Bacteroidota bacterium]|nr:GatB/YqeY domain-containing protein [Bacteroidota bacterium]
MTLSEKVTTDMKVAMKAGNKERLETLRMLRAQILEFEKRGLDRKMNEEDELSILMTAVKRRKEAIEMYEKASRNDLVQKESKELEIISEYLPKQVSQEEATAIIEKIIASTGAASVKDLGKVMPLAVKELKGKIDNKTISEIVKSKLS